jgi:hypothetical protein
VTLVAVSEPLAAPAYVNAVLATYLQLPDTPLRASVADQRLARQLFDRAVPLPTVESALLLGSLRRLARPAAPPPLQPIRSLAYFQPMVDELLAQPPLPDGYLSYLKLKLERFSSAMVQKSTLAPDR